MTVPSRGFRKIRVDGRNYLWRVRFTKCLCCHSRAVVISDASRRGSVVHLPGPTADVPETQAPILPALIAERIREARVRGWVPGEGRGVFVQLGGARG